MSWWDALKNAISGPAPVKPDYSWPTGVDVGRARNADFGYGTGLESFIDGSNSGRMRQFDGLPTDRISEFLKLAQKQKPTKVSGEVSDALAQGYLAANRSALASLGFDPRAMVSVLGEKDLNVNGTYDPERDMVTNFAGRPSTYTHESIHRGLEELRKAGVNVDSKLPSAGEEMFVRYLMRSRMGDNEIGDVAKQYRDLGDSRGHLAAQMKDFENIAAREVARRRPGGPR